MVLMVGMTRFELATPCSRRRSVRFALCALTYQEGRHPGTVLRGRAAEVLSKAYNWQYDHIGVSREATQKKPHFPGGGEWGNGFYGFCLGGKNEELTFCWLIYYPFGQVCQGEK
jgi:hypothetical protein